MKEHLSKLFYYGLLWSLLVPCGQAYAQQSTSAALIEKEVVMLGDPIKLKIKIQVPADSKLQNIDLNIYKNIQNLDYAKDTMRYEKYADLEILDFGVWKPSPSDPLMIPAANLQKNQEGKLENTITVAIYNEGAYSIPGPGIIADPIIDLLPTNGQIVKVQVSEKVLSDSLSLHPIKDIMVEEANISDYLKYIYGILAVLLMAGIGYYFYKRKHSSKEIIEPLKPEIILTADEKAMAALTALQHQSLWQQGHIKEYQSSLTDIIRTYLKDRYGVDAMEMTTDELSQALRHTDFDQQYKNSLREILQVADLVKFAKATPDADIHQIFMDKAIDFVQNTRDNNLQKPKES